MLLVGTHNIPYPCYFFQAQKLLQEVGYDAGTANVSYINIDLPHKKPLSDFNANVEMRLFLVFSPRPVSEDILVDCFCRFGNLVHINLIPGMYWSFIMHVVCQLELIIIIIRVPNSLLPDLLLSGKNIGYAQFSSRESAVSAMNCLHGQTIGNVYMKVLEAEPRRENGSSETKSTRF